MFNKSFFKFVFGFVGIIALGIVGVIVVGGITMAEDEAPVAVGEFE